MRILVVEDDSSVRETLGMVLESYGHDVDLIEDGEHALSYLEQNWPDALLLDLTLPGMTGEQVHEKIKARFGRVPPTVVLSAVQQGETRASLLEGAFFLAKPYTVEELEEVLVHATKRNAA